MGSVGHRWFLLATACAALGCAQGGVGQIGDGGSGGDGGRGRRDGGGSSCDPAGSAASCQDATDLGVVAVGARVESMVGLVDRAGAAQWVKVQFPLVSAPSDGGAGLDGGTPTMEGGGEPRIRLLRNDGDVYRVEVRSECTSVASCGEGGATGMATNLTEWSFTDDPALSDEGPGRFSSRDVAWPSTAYVRIYATADPDCGRYQLEITR